MHACICIYVCMYVCMYVCTDTNQIMWTPSTSPSTSPRDSNSGHYLGFVSVVGLHKFFWGSELPCKGKTELYDSRRDRDQVPFVSDTCTCAIMQEFADR